MNKIKNLGQVYTPLDIVEKMYKLSNNVGSILEPASGDGIFTNYIKQNSNRNIVSVEIDPDNINDDNIIMDFFDLNENEKFDTIIGNPPYVSFRNINEDTLNKIKSKEYLNFDSRTNLYIFFIRKCIEHLNDDGEIIFITPRDFIKATSSINLNNYLFENGTITHWYEYGDVHFFKEVKPNVSIWRFEKNNFARNTNTNDGLKKFTLIDGQISFMSDKTNVKFSDLFFVKVGAVSGMNEIFENDKGNLDFVCSYTKRTGKLKKMFYNIKHDDLIEYKDKLLNRKIKKFNENNWWFWGRNFYESSKERIYVNCKTRDKVPFFMNDCKNYDGSILAIFPKKEIDINKAVNMLNSVDWNELGFKVGERIVFNQKSLENTYLPNNFLTL